MATTEEIEELEEEFIKQFSMYLMALSDVSSEFASGGETNVKLPSVVQAAIAVVPEGAALWNPIAGKVGKAAAKPLEVFIQKIFNKLEREEKKKIYNVLPQKKEDALKMYVEAAVKIFRMFECQFSNVVADGDLNGRRAMAKLAEDAGERVINYVIDENDDIVERELHKSRDFIFNAVLLGKSDGIKTISQGKTLIFKCKEKETEWNTTSLFETSGYIVNEDGKKIFYELEKGSGADKYGYKQLWPFDEFFAKKKWKVRDQGQNCFTEYENKLTFTEEDVAERINQFLERKESKENFTKGEGREIKAKLEEIMQEIKVSAHQDTKGNSVEDGVEELKNDFQQRNNETKSLVEEIRLPVSSENEQCANKIELNDFEDRNEQDNLLRNSNSRKKRTNNKHCPSKRVLKLILCGLTAVVVVSCIIYYIYPSNPKEVPHPKSNSTLAQTQVNEIALQPTNTIFRPKVLKSKWWPDEKELIKSLLKRKIRNKYFVEELYDRIMKDENRMVVITESAEASKYSGMGGVGKTLTAKWYAHHYEQEYDHILWIDCGEGSLLQSFKSLARDLKVEDWDKLFYVEEFARNCFDVLSAFKCLWIYDNAESYKGDDGIINALPKKQENFSCLITSRSREWGFKNGLGKITNFELSIFSEHESLEFLKANLNTTIWNNNIQSQSQLKELSRLLSGLPLALQLAVAALNEGKINLKNYIDKTSIEDVEIIVDAKFDDYEKTINKNVKVSLDLILKEEGDGNAAYDMLMTFGYIRPDDIEVEFFKQILDLTSEEVEGSIKLLSKYSIISKSKIKVDNEIKTVLSIHRLLQQVIRHNGRKTERETMRKILGCIGFIEYKFIPFSKYADESLQKEFPKVKAELLDQQHLKILLKEKRFEESAQLAKFIDEELNTTTTKFNYAISLDKNGQLEECVKTLEGLGEKEMEEKGVYARYDLQMGMRLEKEIAKDLVVGHLLIVYWRMDNKEKVQHILEERKQFKIIHSDESLNSLIRIVTSHLRTRNYSLTKKYRDPLIELDLNATTKNIDLSSCSLSLSSFDFLSAKELTLIDVSFSRGGVELKQVIANEFIDLNNIKRLTLNCYDRKNMLIDLGGKVSLDYLYLFYVQVLDWKEAKWNVKGLKLIGIPFVDKTKMKVKEMEIYSSSLDISCIPQTLQQLELNGVEVFVSGGIDLPLLTHLRLSSMNSSSFSHFQSLQLTHVHFHWMKQVNLYLLPATVTYLKITRYVYVYERTVIVGGRRRLDRLILEGFSFKEVEEYLSHFQTDNLIIHKYGATGISSRELLPLMKKEIKTIAVGLIVWWRKEDFESLSSHVDREANYYLLEGGRGTGIEEKEFNELLLF